MDDKKKSKRFILVIFTMFLVVLILVPAIKFFSSPVSVIIKDRDQNFFRAGNLFICGNTLICRRDPVSVKNRSLLPAESRPGYTFALFSMKDIISIEVVDDNEIIEEESVAVNPLHLGMFKITLQGHEGILVLGVKNERAYGSVRFPSWGKGAVERLKGVKIGRGKVKFVRSASSADEIRRLGANYLFRQNFTGTYTSSGKVIKGIMINDRKEKHEWEAEKQQKGKIKK